MISLSFPYSMVAVVVPQDLFYAVQCSKGHSSQVESEAFEITAGQSVTCSLFSFSIYSYLRCGIVAAFGKPVVPLVYISRAVSRVLRPERTLFSGRSLFI